MWFKKEKKKKKKWHPRGEITGWLDGKTTLVRETSLFPPHADEFMLRVMKMICGIFHLLEG